MKHNITRTLIRFYRNREWSPPLTISDFKKYGGEYAEIIDITERVTPGQLKKDYPHLLK